MISMTSGKRSKVRESVVTFLDFFTPAKEPRLGSKFIKLILFSENDIYYFLNNILPNAFVRVHKFKIVCSKMVLLYYKVNCGLSNVCYMYIAWLCL